MLLLGIHCIGHDTSAVILKDGKIIFGIQEERLSLIKHDGAFPKRSIKACLEAAGAEINDLEAICVSFSPDAFIKEKFLGYNLREFPSSKKLIGQQINTLKKCLELEETIQKETNFQGEIWYCDHHMAHLASSFFVSGFEKSAIQSIDGIGEIACSVGAFGDGNAIEVFQETQINFPHSMGLIYAGITSHLGFRNHCDEGKIMGLASYGDASVYKGVFRDLVSFHSDGTYSFDCSYLKFHLDRDHWFSDKMLAKLPKKRNRNDALQQQHMDLAAGVQWLTEEVMQHSIDKIYEKTSTKNLCLAGGVALNCVANQKVLKRSKFENIFIQPAANDSGTALGAALSYYYQRCKSGEKHKNETSYFGQAFSNATIEQFLNENKIQFEILTNPADFLAQELAAKKIVGWFNGRSEFGPRALGNRSILAAPFPAEMKDILNRKVKHREGFRPFAPIVLTENITTYFEDIVDSPFMLLATRVKSEKQALVPAITHVDGTARVQGIDIHQNPAIYQLLKAFEAKTGTPVLINTSFNVMGQPIVETPIDALNCFQKTYMDYLVFNNHYVIRKNA